VKQKILVIDDDRALCELLRQCLGNEGYEVACLYSGRDAAGQYFSSRLHVGRKRNKL